MEKNVDILIREYINLFDSTVSFEDKSSFIAKQKKLEELSEKIKGALAASESRNAGVFTQMS